MSKPNRLDNMLNIYRLNNVLFIESQVQKLNIELGFELS